MQYSTIKCHICGQEISSGGAARTAHMRKHVRLGEAVEVKKNGKLEFHKPGMEQIYVEPEPFAFLGQQPEPHQPDGVFDVTSALKDLPAIDPRDYYRTSGEAVKKAEKLVSDLYSAAVKARSFKDKLERSRADAKYLETQWDNLKLLVKRKYPRKKDG